MMDKNVLAALIKREGGEEFTDRPTDRGGPTRWGITEQVARAYGYTGPMKDLPRATAEAIYTDRYWVGPRLDQLSEVSDPVARKLLDIGVNMGQAIGVRFLQRALNVLNQGGEAWPDITADGVVGPMTVQALRAFCRRRGFDGLNELLGMLTAQQRVRYMEIAEADGRQETNEFGWQVRAGAV